MLTRERQERLCSSRILGLQVVLEQLASAPDQHLRHGVSSTVGVVGKLISISTS